MILTTNSDFQIVKINRTYILWNYKLNTVIGTFTKYIDAYKALMNILYTENNK